MAIPGTIQFPALSATPSPPPTGSYVLYVKTDNVIYLEDSSGNVYAFGSTDAITALTGDVTAVGPGIVAAVVNSVGGQSAANIANATIAYLAATSSNTPNTIVERDSSGNFSAGTITASLSGNATTATTAGTATNFTGSLVGDVTGTQSSTVVSLVDGYTASQVGASVALTEAATSSNTASTLVERDASGNFSANIVTASLSGNASTATFATSATTSTNFTGSLSGDVTGTQTATSISSPTVTGKLLTGYIIGSNSSILATDSVLTAFEKIQGQLNATSSSAITALTGDVSATGPGSVTTTVNFVGGQTASAIAIATTTVAAATSSNTASTLVERDASGNFAAGTITASLSGNATTATTSSNFTGSLLGDVTGTQGATVVSYVDGRTASDIAAATATVDAATALNTASTLVERNASGNFAANIITASLTGNVTGNVTGNLIGNVTGNVSGSSSSFTGSLSGDVTGTQTTTSISSTTVTGKLLTGYSAGTNTPIIASNSILVAFENLQAQISATSGSAITALIGDATATGPGSAILTLGTVNSNVGTFGSSTSIPSFTVNGKGLITAANGNVVIAPAGTLTGTTLASNVVSSSLTSVGTITSGTWNGTTVAIANGGTNNSTTYTAGSIIFSNGTSLTQDNSNFYWNDTNYCLGIGVIPSSSVMIDGVNTTGASKLVQMTGYGVGSTTGYRGRFARGTLGTPAAAQSGDVLSVISGRGYGASQFAAASTGTLNIVAGETFTNTSNLTYLQFQTTPTGSVTAAESMRIASTGVTLGPQSASTALHQINGGVQRTTRTVTAATFTVDTTTTDDIIYTDSTSNAITITLPTATNGRVLVIQDKTGKAATNHITVTPPGTVQINGVNASVLLGVNYGGWVFISDGTNWTSHRLAQLPTTQAIGSTVIDWSTVGVAGGLFTKTLSANTTFTFSNATAGQTIVIRLTNTASNYTVTWPTIKWPVQTTPIMTTGAFSDVYTIIYDGTTFFGSYVQNF